MKKIGVLGGTFSPVHAEHVALAKWAVNGLSLDKIIIMPTFMPPHKDVSPAPAKDRLKMLELAFRGVDKVEISDYEILKGGRSYTYQTAEYFKSVYPNDELYFLVGADMLKDFKNWRNPERILECFNLVACGREEHVVDYNAEEDYFNARFNKSFIKLSYCGKKCSSTKIRIYSMLGLDVSEYCGNAVAEYIKNHGLYKGDRFAEFVKGNLKHSRLVHTANVIVTALKKAKETGISEDRIILTAMLHDCAKYLSPEDYKEFNMPPSVPKPVQHAYLGAFIAEKVLGVTDGEVIDAIRYHTSGKADMSTLAKLVFVADMIEEGRDYEGVEKLRAAYELGLDYAFKECLKEEMIHLQNKGADIFIETINAYEYYIK